MFHFLSRPPLHSVVKDYLYETERELLKAEANLAHYQAVVASLKQRRELLNARLDPGKVTVNVIR